MSLLDFMLAGDESGAFQAHLNSDAADLAEGRTWGLYHRGRLLARFPARYIAEIEQRDAADAADLPMSAFQVREVLDLEVAA